LVELLVVVAIIGILISLVMPSLASVRDRAKTVQCASNLRQIGQALVAYQAENGGNFPVGLQGASVGDRVTWLSELRAYLRGGSDILADQDQASLRAIFTCPAAGLPGRGTHHYSCHPILMPHITDGGARKIYPLHNLNRPSEVVAIMDASQRPAMNGSADAQVWSLSSAYTRYDASAGDIDQPIDPGPNIDSDFPPGRANIRWRHNGQKQANFLFADAHVDTLRPDEVLNRNVRAD
jgi:prepilin-type processing-associated H-X9-DG protein